MADRCSVPQYDLGYFHDEPGHFEADRNRPVILASLSIPSWNQIAGFLESMRQPRDASGFAA